MNDLERSEIAVEEREWELQYTVTFRCVRAVKAVSADAAIDGFDYDVDWARDRVDIDIDLVI